MLTIKEIRDELIVAEARGTVALDDYHAVIKELEAVADTFGRANLIVFAHSLDAITPDPNDGEIDFKNDILADIDRIAIVGSPAQAKLVYAFFVVLLTEQRIQTFDPSQETDALDWVLEKQL